MDFKNLLDLVLTLAVTITLLVFFHELGHFLFAKLFKMRVLEFAIGFGKPKLRLFHDGETEYTLRAWPLGGFVRIAGMEIEDEAEQRFTNLGGKKDADERDRTPSHFFPKPTQTALNTALNESIADQAVFHEAPTSMLGASIEQAVAHDAPDEPDAASDPDGFNNRPIYQRFLVILAGPVFSLLLGWMTLCLIGLTVGISSENSTRIAGVIAGFPAEKAGLHAGDTIVAINGTKMTTGKQMIETINAAPGKPIQVTVVRGKSPQEDTLTLTPQPAQQEGKTIGRIGIQPMPDMGKLKRLGVGDSIVFGTGSTVGFFRALIGIFARGEARQNLGGPIKIVQATQDAVTLGGPSKMLLFATLSLSLAFMNMLPIPILDGGHLTLFTLEAIRRRKLTAVQTQRVFMTGFAVLAVLIVAIWINDIASLPIFHRGKG